MDVNMAAQKKKKQKTTYYQVTPQATTEQQLRIQKMRDELNAPDRRDYLYQPVNDLHKIHGRFTDEAKTRAPSVTSGMPGKVALGVLAVAGIVLTRLITRRKP